MNTTFSAVARVLRLECLLGENKNKYKVSSVSQHVLVVQRHNLLHRQIYRLQCSTCAGRLNPHKQNQRKAKLLEIIVNI